MENLVSETISFLSSVKNPTNIRRFRSLLQTPMNHKLPRAITLSHISGSHQIMSLEMRYKSSCLVTEYIKHITTCVSEVEPLYGSAVTFATDSKEINRLLVQVVQTLP